MSDKPVEIRTTDGIVLVLDEDTLPYDTLRFISVARHRLKKGQEVSRAATDAGFEVAQHPVTREKQRTETLNIEKELYDMNRTAFLEGVKIIIFVLPIIVVLFFLLCYLFE